MTKILVGVDYGARHSGNTATAVLNAGIITINQTKKGEDTDAWLKSLLSELDNPLVFIDAPLSLPAVYFGKNQGDGDFMYRSCDRELNAMSPMFLGGLTARAMRLVSEMDVEFHETYPSALVDELEIHRKVYKKDKAGIEASLKLLAEKVDLDFTGLELSNWHQFDALLALSSAYRYVHKQVLQYGNADEGLIFV